MQRVGKNHCAQTGALDGALLPLVLGLLWCASPRRVLCDERTTVALRPDLGHATWDIGVRCVPTQHVGHVTVLLTAVIHVDLVGTSSYMAQQYFNQGLR